jgi:hypothetical protein
MSKSKNIDADKRKRSNESERYENITKPLQSAIIGGYVEREA